MRQAIAFTVNNLMHPARKLPAQALHIQTFLELFGILKKAILPMCAPGVERCLEACSQFIGPPMGQLSVGVPQKAFRDIAAGVKRFWNFLVFKKKRFCPCVLQASNVVWKHALNLSGPPWVN